MNIYHYNQTAWDREVETGNPWTVPVSPEKIEAARRGEWQIILTPTKPVPMHWFGEIRGADVLCLASGGGQQAPILAAAGARVTVFDNSPRQLEQDRIVAEREGLDIRIEQGTMTDLSRLRDAAFDLIVHPVSNVFIPDVRPVWREAFRVLRSGGSLLSGITNPLVYIFDHHEEEQGRLVVRPSIPYSDLTSLTPEELERFTAPGEPLEFGHTLEDQIGGQIDAGFIITGFYEDLDPGRVLCEYISNYMVTKGVKAGSAVSGQ